MLDILHILHGIHRMPCKSLVQPFDLSALWCDISAHWSSSSSMTFKGYREHWYIYIFFDSKELLFCRCTVHMMHFSLTPDIMRWNDIQATPLFFFYMMTDVHLSIIDHLHSSSQKIQVNLPWRQHPVCCSICHLRQVLWRVSLVLLLRSRPMLLLAFTKRESTSCFSTENKQTQFS